MTRSKKISQLETNGGIHGTDVFPVSNIAGTSTYRVSMDDLVDYMDQNANFNPTIVSVIKTSNFSIDSTTKETIFLIDASNGKVTVDLNNYSEHKNQSFVFKRLDDSRLTTDNEVIIKGSPGNQIDGQDEYVINAQYETVTIVSDGTSGWYII